MDPKVFSCNTTQIPRPGQRNVTVFVEGPGHVPLNQIVTNIQVQKTLCQGAPFYVLGPLVTNVSPGYDHISAAIGGAVAGMAGADFLCYVTPAEHLRLPSIDNVREGVIARASRPMRPNCSRLSWSAGMGRLNLARKDRPRLGADAFALHQSGKGATVPRLPAAAGRRKPVQHVRGVLRDKKV